jgi:excisionase family DNA binding protein
MAGNRSFLFVLKLKPLRGICLKKLITKKVLFKYYLVTVLIKIAYYFDTKIVLLRFYEVTIKERFELISLKNQNMENILTLENASKILGLKERTLAEKVRSGEIPAYRKFGKWYILQIELVEFIKEGERKYKQTHIENGKSPSNSIKSTKNKPKETNYTKSVGRYLEISDFMLSSEYESIPNTATKFGVSIGLINKIRRGQRELGIAK